VLRFRVRNAQWAASFIRGDTLRGIMVFSGFGQDGVIPHDARTTGSPASGVRIRCP
jgi:hypothetical protein